MVQPVPGETLNGMLHGTITLGPGQVLLVVPVPEKAWHGIVLQPDEAGPHD